MKAAESDGVDGFLDSESILISRFVLFLFFLFSSFGIAFAKLFQDLYDPVYVRGLHSFFLIGVFALSFLSKSVKNMLPGISLFFFVTMAIHSFLLLYWNHLNVGYLVGVILVITVSGVALHRRRYTFVYLPFVLTVGFTVGLLTPKPDINFSLYFSAISTPALFSVIILQARLRTLSNLRNSKQKLQQFQKRILSDLELARKTQANLMKTELPIMQGWKIELLYEPLDEVGGDFVRFESVSPYETDILFADVSGHGIPAAMIASMASLAFSNVASRAENPAKGLEKIHHVLFPMIRGFFMTATYLRYNSRTRTLYYSYAGHHPAIHLDAENQLGMMEGQGSLLLAISQPAIRQYSLNVQKKDKVMLFSDGLFETINKEDEILGMEKFIDLVSECSKNSNGNMLRDIMRKTEEGCIVRDDRTMLLLEFL